MRGIKPFKLSFICRPFSWGHSHHLGIGAIAYFPLQETPALLSDQEMWMEVPAVLGKEFVLDAGVPKSRAEFLLAGAAYQPGGERAPVRHVRARVGQVEKSLYVVGDRFWRGEQQTEPIPFASMPITWDRAFGGEGFDRNPGGKGFAPIEVDGVEIHPMPNIEHAGRMIRTKKERPAPASFRPLDLISPDRFAMAGTYDKQWLDTRYPGFAEDMDWRFWNMAPPDQQQEAPFRGDEPILLEHLHPTRPRLEARLPGIRARAFVLQTVGEDEAARQVFHEVALKLTTVWLLPDIERGILVFHGAHPIVEDDAHDLDVLMVAAERVDAAAPRPLSHYESVMARRIGEEGAFETLNEHDLMPEGFQGLGDGLERNLELTTIEQLRLKRQREASNARIEEARAKVAALGLDPDEHGPKVPEPDPEPVSLAEVPKLLEEMRVKSKELEAEGEAQREVQMQRLEALCEATGISLDDMKEELATHPSGPPVFSAAGKRREMRKLAA
ncbi:MAG TPA: DUF2169 domain-containing protein, partial [Candidatus Limnocylindrales bacterium]|nr:DUF2169 domain-containing protein [Candidatus Limnocylindrales bacterium]